MVVVSFVVGALLMLALLLPCLIAAAASSTLPTTTPTTTTTTPTTKTTTPMVRVGPGVVQSPVEKNAAPTPVAAFWLDVDVVRQSDLLAFVVANPRWRRGRVPRFMAEASYLASWASPTSLGSVSPDAPATEVSWFVARAFCASRGQRLPTTAEWELAAMASETALDGRSDPVFQKKVLRWYAEPSSPNLRVGLSPKNAWGVRDLHGLVWEWVDDFSASMVATDARTQNDADVVRFCGGGAENAADPADYVSFMRFALRGSLQANYVTTTLGFRCAKDLP